MAAPRARRSRKAPAGAAADWLAGLFAGDRAALSRAITAVENGTGEAAGVLAAIQPHLGHAKVVGITGAPGVGKSTLTGAYVAELRRRESRVGVVAVDPSSPLTGGALLGDRIRMTVHGSDPEVFVRSVAARGHLGGLSRTTARVIDVMDAAGKDVVIVETVGAGQSEVEIAGLADVNLVVSAPGLGDDVQAIKAGILEIADILVVNKADLPLAERTARQLERLAGPAAVLRTVATSGAGIAELADAIEARWAGGPGGRRASPRRRARRLIVAAAADRVRTALEALDDKAIEALCDAVLDGSLDIDEAAKRGLELVAEDRE
jgi:LAO/AO transport system kinase